MTFFSKNHYFDQFVQRNQCSFVLYFVFSYHFIVILFEFSEDSKQVERGCRVAVVDRYDVISFSSAVLDH